MHPQKAISVAICCHIARIVHYDTLDFAILIYFHTENCTQKTLISYTLICIGGSSTYNGGHEMVSQFHTGCILYYKSFLEHTKGSCTFSIQNWFYNKGLSSQRPLYDMCILVNLMFKIHYQFEEFRCFLVFLNIQILYNKMKRNPCIRNIFGC